MAFSPSLTPQTSFTTLSRFPPASTPTRSSPLGFLTIVRAQEPPAESAKASTSDEAKVVPKEDTDKPVPSKLPKKPVYSMKKGQIVRVDKEKYLNSVNYLSVGHPPFYKGLDYIYEDRGEILDLRIFETGEYALISWVGVPTAPAWLPTDMLIKSDKLDYERL